MHAWKVNRFGEPADVLTLETNAESFEAKSNQVKIKVEAAGLGLPDVFMCRNTYPLTPPLQVFDFEDGLRAIQHIASGKVEGKVVVRV